MFGHVLSSPGNVDFQKVDCLGIILSHVTVDGKENLDFLEGEFGLAIRSISFIKETWSKKIWIYKWLLCFPRNISVE